MITPELTHASQVQRLKQEKGYWWASDYWSANVYQQASNGENPYGQKGGSRWQQIALSEGWGYFMEWTMARDILGWNKTLNYINDAPDKERTFAETEFPINYGEMYRELIQLGCSYQNIEKSLGVYSLNEFRNILISKYPYWNNQISNIIIKYE